MEESPLSASGMAQAAKLRSLSSRVPVPRVTGILKAAGARGVDNGRHWIKCQLEDVNSRLLRCFRPQRNTTGQGGTEVQCNRSLAQGVGVAHTLVVSHVQTRPVQWVVTEAVVTSSGAEDKKQWH